MRKLLLIIALISSPVWADTFRIEIDYMVGGTPYHSHKPSQLVLDAVIQMFACQGHTLIIDLDEQVPHYDVLIRDPNNCSGSLFDYSGAPNSFGALKDSFFNHDGQPGWHYCIFAHQYEDNACSTATSSGLASGTNFFIVTLGAFSGDTGTEFQQAATLAHEFGHNLGLSHCGALNYCGKDTSDPNYVGPRVPNMPSTMSYRYQLGGVRNTMLCSDFALTFEEALFKDIDYSHGRMCALDENDLDEFKGTGMIWTDWNCNGVLETGVRQDINGDKYGWCGSTGNTTYVFDYNEWANLEDGAWLLARNTPQDREELERRQRVLDLEPCITAEEWEIVRQEIARKGGCPDPTLSVEPCITGENVYIGAPNRFPDGTCTFPFTSVQVAHDVSPTGSVFYLAPGDYDESGTVILNKPGKYFCERKDGTGSAVIH